MPPAQLHEGALDTVYSLRYCPATDTSVAKLKERLFKKLTKTCALQQA
jgi:flagellar biosynthesis regulator FlaF